ncbi:hypothetical protein Tco_1320711 [Tanacetum coccineum]
MATNEETNAAGTDTRLPMLVENDYESWKIRIHRLLARNPLHQMNTKFVNNLPANGFQKAVSPNQTTSQDSHSGLMVRCMMVTVLSEPFKRKASSIPRDVDCTVPLINSGNTTTKQFQATSRGCILTQSGEGPQCLPVVSWPSCQSTSATNQIQSMSMKKMNEKPGHVRPANDFYTKLNALMFVPQKELSGDQAYWLSANEIASQASKPATPCTPLS